MPVYNFVCARCGHNFEQVVSMGQEITDCPQCSETALRDTTPTAHAKTASKWKVK